MDDNKRSRFEEAFERGQQGEVSSYEAWLNDQGFSPERVTRETYIAEYFQEHPEEAPNHDEQLEKIAEFLGFFSRRQGAHHIPIIGVTGIGKTQFLHTITYMLEQVDLDIPYRLFSASRFAEDGENESVFYEFLDEISGLEKAVVLLDDCQEDKRIEHSLGKINEKVDELFLISTWTPERWRMEQDRINDVIQVSQETELSPLSEQNTVAALETAVKQYSEGHVELPRQLYTRIFQASMGIARLFHRMLQETLKQTFLGDLELGDVRAVEIATEKLHLENAKDRVYEISDKKLTILKHILLSRHPKGRRPSELVDILDRDKSTVSYHLQSLTEDRVLEKEKQGRSAFYRVSEPLKPVVQRRVEQEVEFYA